MVEKWRNKGLRRVTIDLFKVCAMSELITSALKRGDSQKALELAKSLVDQSPDHSDSYYWLALASQQSNEKSKALEAIDKAIALAPNRNEYVMVRSVILLDDQDFNVAQSGLMDTLALNPNQLNAYVGLIHIAIAQRNIVEAKRLLKLAERVNADDGNVIVAAGAIAHAEGDIDTALKYFTTASEINPNNPLALSNMGLCFLHKNMPAFAEQSLKRANELAPNNVGILRALVQSQIDQEDFVSVEATVSNLLQLKPEDISSLSLRAKLRRNNQDFQGALTDVENLYRLQPNEVNTLRQLCTLLIQLNRLDEARNAIELALDSNLKNDDYWQLRHSFETSLSVRNNSVIKDWLTQLPNSPYANEALAVYLEMAGELNAAKDAAEKALSITESLPLAQFVKLRQEIRDEPKAALARAQKLTQFAVSNEAQRMLLGWLGIIHDRLNEYEQAASTFMQMAQYEKLAKSLPLLVSEHQTADPKITGQLLWSPVGARVERVFNILAPVLGNQLLVDRNQPSPARLDGFGPFRFAPDSEQAGTAIRWQAGVKALGIEPEEAVDWIPQWDAYTDAALDGAKLVVLSIDPRDAFLNWMVFDNAQAYIFLPNIQESAEWLALVFEAVADTLQRKNQNAHLVKLDDMDTNASEICNALTESLKLSVVPNAEILAKPIMALGGMANQFPTGHWRNYQPFFAEAFARLTPVAVRLGYSEN